MIDGGYCTHAWAMLVGCQNVYTISEDAEGSGQYHCQGTFNPNTQQWDEIDNSPHSIQGLWPMAWPDVGGGGDMNTRVSSDELFERMCKWDDENYIMGAGTIAGSDHHTSDGIVDGHAYTVMTCIDNAGGTEFDMVLVRNPWGQGEFHAGDWQEGGPNWQKYPQVYEACGRPVEADDGMFWLEKKDFFCHFKTVYLCAKNMTEFKHN